MSCIRLSLTCRSTPTASRCVNAVLRTHNYASEHERAHFEILNPCVILFGAGATRGAFSERMFPPPVDKDFFEIAGQIKGRGTRAIARKVLKSVWELYGRTNNVGLEEYYREVETRARIGSFAKSQNQPRTS